MPRGREASGSKIYLGQRMGSAPWMDAGSEEEREIKDEGQVPRKSDCCATASVRAVEEDIG